MHTFALLFGEIDVLAVFLPEKYLPGRRAPPFLVLD